MKGLLLNCQVCISVADVSLKITKLEKQCSTIYLYCMRTHRRNPLILAVKWSKTFMRYSSLWKASTPGNAALQKSKISLDASHTSPQLWIPLCQRENSLSIWPSISYHTICRLKRAFFGQSLIKWAQDTSTKFVKSTLPIKIIWKNCQIASFPQPSQEPPVFSGVTKWSLYSPSYIWSIWGFNRSNYWNPIYG